MGEEEAIKDIEYIQTQLEICKQPRSECLDVAIKALEQNKEVKEKNTL